MQARSKQDVSKLGLTTFLRKQGKSGMEPVLSNGHGNETGIGKRSNLVVELGSQDWLSLHSRQIIIK